MHSEAQAKDSVASSGCGEPRAPELQERREPLPSRRPEPAGTLIARIYERLSGMTRLFSRPVRREWEFPQPPDHEPFSAAVVGTRYEPRNELVRSLGFRERVWLWREPWNPNDRNAIAVTKEQGIKLGYLSRYLAPMIAPYMDGGHNPLPAVITELASDIKGALLGLKVSFYLPRSMIAQMRDGTPALSYCFEIGEAGTRYLSLDCDEQTLYRVTAKLAAVGHPCIRQGLSSRPAIDGRQYRWYLVLDGEVNEPEIQEFFRMQFGLVPPEQQVEQKVKEWVDTFEGENLSLKEENERLRQLIDQTRAELERAEAQALAVQDNAQRKERELRRAQRQELPKFLQLFAPNLVLVGNSIDVLTVELRSYEDVLEKLRLLAYAPEQVRAKRVQSASEWSELHFSTGRADDGRIYFKRSKDCCVVLVSFKQQQERDIAYLKRYKA